MFPIPELTEADRYYPSRALEWMPKREDIPEEFHYLNSDNPGARLTHKLFFGGEEKISDLRLYPKVGVDSDKAFGAAMATLRSYAPSHEYKEEAVAYMLSEWFDDYWYVGDKKSRVLGRPV